MVERNQNKISALVMDMLTFSKEREPDPVAGDLNHLVGEVVELMQARAAELEVELDWQPAADMPACAVRSRGDPPRGAERRDQRHGCLREADPTAGVGGDAPTCRPKRRCKSMVEDNGVGHPGRGPGKNIHASSSRKREAAAPAWACR